MRAGTFLPCFFIVYAWSFCCSQLACADSGQDILRQQNQIIQQEEQRRRMREDEMRRLREAPPTPVPVPETLQPPVQSGSAACFTVTSIIFDGVSLLSADEISRLKSPYINQCMSLDDITALVRSITNAYVEKGYVATRAYLPVQDVSGGELRIVVVEGFVEGVILNDGTGRQQNQLLTAFPCLKNKPLNLRDLEQGLDQMNRLPSNDARMRLEPGKRPGGSIVHIDNLPKKRWRVSGGLANNGQKTTGRELYTLSFDKDNLIGLNDQFTFYSSADTRTIGGGGPRTQSMSGYMSVPYGYWTLYGSLSLYSYNSKLHGTVSDYTSSGETTTASVGIDRVVHRDTHSKTIAGVSFTKREISNYIDQTKLTLSSYDLASSTIRLQHSRRIGSAVVSAGAEYHHGIAALGAERNVYYLSGVPDTEYDKYVGTASANIPISPFENELALSSSLYAQYSPNHLYGAEQISVGGDYTVRGFRDESVSGDKGMYIRNELVWTQSVPTYLHMNSAFSTVQPFVFYDAGYVHPLADRESDRGMLQGVGCGVRLRGDNISLELMTGKPVDRPDSIQKNSWITATSVRVTF